MLNINIMSNISCINNDCILLDKESLYVVIDSLYLMEIKKYIYDFNDLDGQELITRITNEVFPYTDLPFVLFRPCDSNFSINRIEKVNYSDELVNSKNAFSGDTGLIIFLNFNILKEFIEKFDYDLLVNHPIEDFDIEYWNTIVEDFNLEDIALVCSSITNDTQVFDGGTYKINL
jgi:hypothetical protein